MSQGDASDRDAAGDAIQGDSHWRSWLREATGPAMQSWLASLLVHMLVMIVLALTLGTIRVVQNLVANSISLETPPPIDEAKVDPPDPHEIVEMTTPALIEPSQIDVTVLQRAGVLDGDVDGGSLEPGIGDVPSGPTGQPGPSVPSTIFQLPPGAITGVGPGPAETGSDGLNSKSGDGGGSPWPGRDPTKKRQGISGVTTVGELSVSHALRWLYRHRDPKEGNWSLEHRRFCQGGACGGAGETRSDSAATSLALLCYLAAGQTHQTKGRYQAAIHDGLAWLVRNQKQNGDLSAGGPQMYSHGIATIALCEAYGMTRDSRLGGAAQAALDFIASGQNTEGGWRYTHGAADSDTSVVGWQVMALKSGVLAGLKVDPARLAAAKKYLTKASVGNYGEQFSYQPGGQTTETMTSVGLLLTQYLGAARGDPAVVGGVRYLSEHMPAAESRNTYYWYYATQAMHNCPGPEWDRWNMKMRRILIETQVKNGCESGSWSPDGDAWGKAGGRLMTTALSCLTLEVYYRYLPLYGREERR